MIDLPYIASIRCGIRPHSVSFPSAKQAQLCGIRIQYQIMLYFGHVYGSHLRPKKACFYRNLLKKESIWYRRYCMVFFGYPSSFQLYCEIPEEGMRTELHIRVLRQAYVLWHLEMCAYQNFQVPQEHTAQCQYDILGNSLSAGSSPKLGWKW